MQEEASPLKINGIDAGFAAYVLVENLLNALALNKTINPIIRDAVAKIAAQTCAGYEMQASADLIKQRFAGMDKLSLTDAALAIGFEVKSAND